jgi:hypothetical protein
VITYLKAKFPAPADANDYYFSSVTSRDDPEAQLHDLSNTFSALCHSRFGLEVPKDFLLLAARAMIQLHRVKCSV